MCGIDRTAGEKGFCGMSDRIKVARAALHYWEEPGISGSTGSGTNSSDFNGEDSRNVGSGTIFFSGCNLRCIYCQNFNISRGEIGKEISEERLSEIFLELKDKGALNINLVTGTHYIPGIINAIDMARMKNFDLPIVWNTGGYESDAGISLLTGYIDIYLTDLKYMNDDLSLKYSNCRDYFKHASKVLDEMVHQAGIPEFYPLSGQMKKGVIVRHLVLPGLIGESKKILRYLHDRYGNDIYISIMSQYTPLKENNLPDELNRSVSADEYKRVVDFADKIGIENAYIQEGSAAKESFIPAFDLEGV